MKNILARTKKYSLLIIIIVVAIIASYFIWFKNGEVKNEILTIQPADFVQTVSVSGKVAPAKSVELGFNRSGKVTSVPVIVGQQVGAGQLIAQIDSSDAALALESAKIDLKKMLESSSTLNQSELSKEDESSLSEIDKSFLDMATIFEGLNLILNNYQVSTYKTDLPNNTARAYLETAQLNYYKTKSIYDLALANYRETKRPLSKTAVAKLTESTYSLSQNLSQTVNDTNTFVSYIYDQNNQPENVGVDKGRIATWRTLTSNMVSALSNNRSTLKDSSLDIEAQRLAVQQKENDYANYFLRAPFDGIITRLDIKTGEQAIAGQATISMINSGLFQIESYVPEINISTLKVGNPAKVTLDAYGSEVSFDAQVISIDPAETIRDGVSTYKVKLQFSTADQRIKSGMTANLLITSLKKPNVISVPIGAIINRNGQKFVQVITNKQITEKMITPGEVGLLGQTEILTGLNIGDNVILNPKTN